MNNGATNEMTSKMLSDYQSEKLDKQNEINNSMTFTEKGADEYTQALNNVGGNN